MSTPVEGVSSTIDANPAPFFQALDRVLTGTKSTFTQVEGSITSISGPLGTIMSRFNALGALLGGGVLFKKAIAETVEFTKDSMALGRALGATAQTGSNWISALADVNATHQELETATKGLIRGLRADEEGLNALGLVTRTTTGELRKMDELMLDAIKTVNSYKEGADRNAAAQQIFGKGASGTSQLLLINSQTIEQNKQLQEELGLVVGQDNVEAYKKYDTAMDGAEMAVKTMWTTVGQLLLPVLTQMATWFREIAPAAIVVLKGALGGIVTAIHGIIMVINVVWYTFALVFKSMTAIGRGFADTMGALLRGDFSGAKAAAAGVYDDLKALNADYTATIVKKAEETKANIAAIWGFGAGTESAAPAQPEGKDFKNTKDTGKDPSVSLMEKATRERLQLIKRGLDDATKYLDELTALDESAAAHKRDIALKELDFHQDSLRRLAEAGQISKADELAFLVEMEGRRYEIERAATQRRIDDIGLEKLEHQKAYQDLELLQMEHDRRMAELSSQQRAQRIMPWKDLFSGIQSGFQGVLAQFSRGTMSISNLWRGMLGAVLDMMGQMAAQMAAKWLMLKVMSLLFAKSAIAGESAKAGAAGTASMAGAPFPLNLGAPVFGAAMAALSATYMAVPSAAMGYDIPRGLNPLVQAHGGEMILPEKYSDLIRSMAESAADAGARGGERLNISVRPVGQNDVLITRGDLMKLAKKLGAVGLNL